MRGIEDFNFPAFDAATIKLRALGHGVFSPAERDRDAVGDVFHNADGDESAIKEFSLRDALTADTEFICQHADAIAVLPGWENSKGALAETALARALGLPVAPVEAFTEDGITPATGGEVRSVSSSGGEKGVKRARFDLIPIGPLTQLAELYGAGSQKYADRNWQRGYEWSKSYAALMRHITAFWGGEDLDPETGIPHPIAAAWHAMALTEFMASHPSFDDRP